MANYDRDRDTICALATGAGRSGIAVIRVSGPDSFSRLKQLCSFLPDEPQSHRIYHGLLKDRTQTRAIDEVLVSFFTEGRSYTGDETCEVSCHGNPVVASQILSQLVELGCRPADRGEFTFRAFMNGKIDLVQAESVLNLIESTSKKAAGLALEQLRGQLSGCFEELEKNAVWVLSRLEAGIDFSTEGIEIADPAEVRARLGALIQACEKLVESYGRGRLISDGIKIVLAGRPNAGKSSLLNALIRSDRAIVSPAPGTTRDTVEVIYNINGIAATLVDTAGLRETGDDVERQGVERSRRALEAADLILLVEDARLASLETTQGLNINDKKFIVVLNKVDLLTETERDRAREIFAGPVVETVATKSFGLAALEEAIAESFSLEAADETVTVIHARHEQNLREILVALRRAKGALENKLSAEFVALDLREALAGLGRLLGRGLSEDVVNKIFQDFCIGK
jgi:tRNA modification GTPase